MAELPPYPGAPRWVKVFGTIVLVLVLLFVMMKVAGIGGRHGPGRHLQSGDVGGQTAPSSVTDEQAPSGGLGGHTPPEGGH
ncbi:MAG: hypothetical protein ACRELD_10970 [Longimicrobiales bacterium]